jgi:1,2-diacylglycerol 3-alpha-glucosyltransferase
VKRFSVAMVAACPFPVNYGSPAAIRELSETLSEMGHDVHVVTYPYGENLSVGTARVHRIASWGKSARLQVGPSIDKPFLDLLLLLKLCRVIRQEKIEIIHGHNYEGGLAGVLAKVITGKPLVYNAVNLMSDELKSYGFIKPRFLAHWLAAALDWFVPILPDHVIAVTQELYDWHARHGVAKERLTLIPCGVKPPMFDGADAEKFRSKYAVGSRPVIMYTGVHSAFQRVDYLLRAFTVVLRAEPSALLMVISPIENENDFPANVALAKSLGIDENVIFVAPHTLEDLPHYLAMATVTVVPRPECPGHPIKLLNYMMAAKPTVCFSGAAKGVTHMHDAFLIPDHDWEQMGKAIVTILRDPELGRRLGGNARQTVLQNLDWQILAKKVEAIYAMLLAIRERNSLRENRSGWWYSRLGRTNGAMRDAE